jgi:uncharacterized protein (DUF1697 family)
MTIHIALLRAVNVGGRGAVAMAALRSFATELGLEDARTLLQSGNLVFRSGAKPDALERLLEAEAMRRLDLRTEFFVRTAKEWAAIVEANPFPDEAQRDPGHLVLMVLKNAPAADAVKALQAAIKGPEIVRTEGRQAYITYPDGIGRSKLTHTIIEKKLGTRGTGRNWNTVMKLRELAHSSN